MQGHRNGHDGRPPQDTGRQTSEWTDPRSQISGSWQGELLRRASEYNAERDPFRVHNLVHANAIGYSTRIQPTPRALLQAFNDLSLQDRDRYARERETLANTRAVANNNSFHRNLEALHQPVHQHLHELSSQAIFLARYKLPEQWPVSQTNSTLIDLGYKDPTQFVYIRVEHKDPNSLPPERRSPYYTGFFHPQEGKSVIVSAYKDSDRADHGTEPSHFSETLFNMQCEAAIRTGQDISRLAANEFAFYDVSNTKTLNSLADYLSREQTWREFEPSNLRDFMQAINTPFPKAIQHYLGQHNYAIVNGPKGISKIVIWRTPSHTRRFHMKIEVSQISPRRPQW